MDAKADGTVRSSRASRCGRNARREGGRRPACLPEIIALRSLKNLRPMQCLLKGRTRAIELFRSFPDGGSLEPQLRLEELRLPPEGTVATIFPSTTPPGAASSRPEPTAQGASPSFSPEIRTPG